jgi:predicted metal-binding membrane protein
VNRRPQAVSAALPRPVATAIVLVLLVCAAAAWLFTAQQAASMAGMGGLAMLGAGLFLVTWIVMMVAMMFPSIAPMVLAHAGIVRSRGEGPTPTVAFVLGFLVVWSAAGLVPLGIIQVLGSSFAAPISTWLPRLGGAVIALAGIYQFTPFKNACLSTCRSPLGFILTHDFGSGIPGAARAGIAHGLYCLGCCWAIMAVLAVVGLMNLVWMAVFAALFFLEKNWRHGVTLSRVSGAACALLGLTLIVQPDVLHIVGGPLA